MLIEDLAKERAEYSANFLWNFMIVGNLGRQNENVDFQGSERTADYSKLLEYGLDSKVADKLDDIYKVKHLYKCQLTFSKILNEKSKSSPVVCC